MKQIYTHKTNPILKQTSTRNINPKPFSMLVQPQTKLDFLNIFMIQNKGKGPPGRTRSPGMAYCPTRDNQPLAFNAQYPELIEESKILNENELQTHIKTKFLSQLNFTIMKKQIFILVMALFAVNVAWGQATHQTAPIPLGTCNDTPLKPVPGRAYTYGVDGTGSTFTWWATKNPNFITTTASVTTTNMATDKLEVTPGELDAVDGNYATPGSGNTVSITWSSQILAGTSSGTASGGKTPTFVVVQAEDAASCTNNFKVYQIEPIVAFTVDVLPMNPDGSVAVAGYTASITSCFSKVESATYNTGTGTIDYNYGTNVLYYEVVAANFIDFWNTSFKIGGLVDGQTADVDWSYTTGPTATYTNVQNGVTGVTGSIIDVSGTASATVASTTNTSEGVSIYVRVTVHNGDYEGITDSQIALAVNATDSEGNEDKDNANCVVPTPNFEDVATQTLSSRPTVGPNSPASNPDEFVLPTP